MIENGRSKGSSWSLRQTSVYHRKDFGAEAETWIIIQPSKSVQNYLELETKSVLSNEESAVRRHTVILRRSVEGWREYISYIRLRLEQLDEKANFTRVGKKTYLDDYDVSLQDNQTLHKLQRKLFRARLVIEATLATVSRLRNWFEQLSAFDVLDSTIISRSTDELNDITAALVYHKKNLKGLTAYSRGTAELLQQITAYRAMTNLQSTASALETSLYLLRGIATASQLQTQSILTIAQSGSKDSLRIKTLTHIATVYLPPTLIAVSLQRYHYRGCVTLTDLPKDYIQFQPCISQGWEQTLCNFATVLDLRRCHGVNNRHHSWRATHVGEAMEKGLPYLISS